MTQAMLDGRTISAHASHLTWPARPPSAGRWCLFIRAWADSVADMPVPPCSSQPAVSRHARGHGTACAAFDYVISPVAPCPLFAAELPSPINDPLRPLERIGFIVPYNMSEQPAASVNCGYTASGLPIGLQNRRTAF